LSRCDLNDCRRHPSLNQEPPLRGGRDEKASRRQKRGPLWRPHWCAVDGGILDQGLSKGWNSAARLAKFCSGPSAWAASGAVRPRAGRPRLSWSAVGKMEAGRKHWKTPARPQAKHRAKPRLRARLRARLRPHSGRSSH